jgi:CSLREA domain-containing protein
VLFQTHIIAFIAIVTLCIFPFVARAFIGTGTPRTPASNQPPKPARLSEAVSIRAAGRGNPTIKLNDGHDVLTAYVGPEEMRVALEQNSAEPLSLASADFDEDGVPDLITGYSYNAQGIVTLMRGNVDSIYPNAPEAKQRRTNGIFTDAPFLSPARVFGSPVAADFIGAGDFDGDSHWDVVTASRTRGSLVLFSGDGHGGLGPAQEIVLPGTVTALTTGEINRADGLTDVVVGIITAGGAEVLEFEGPNGALKAEPEVLAMQGRVTALAVGQLDSSYEMDLAIGAGDNLVIAHGRDRKLSLDNEQKEKVLPARTETRGVGASITSLVIGDFDNNHQPAVALLTQDGEVEVISPSQQSSAAIKGAPASLILWEARSLNAGSQARANALVRAKMSSVPGDDLLLLDGSTQGMRLLSNTTKATATETTLEVSAQPVAALTMRLNGDALTDLVVLQKGQGAPVMIQTDVTQTFVVNSTADTNDGQCTTAVNGCTLREAINAANANPGADTINFNIPGSAPYTISPTSRLPVISESLTIDGTSQPGFGGAPIIEINGANAGAGSFGFGLEAAGNTFRGLVINRFDQNGLYVTTINGGHIVEGNYIGTNLSGTAAAPNRSGIQFDSGNNVIGGHSRRREECHCGQ